MVHPGCPVNARTSIPVASPLRMRELPRLHATRMLWLYAVSYVARMSAAFCARKVAAHAWHKFILDDFCVVVRV